MFGWDDDGEVKLNDVVCNQNEAGLSGGCLFSAGRVIIRNGTVMQGNLAGSSGGCICEEYSAFGCLVGLLATSPVGEGIYVVLRAIAALAAISCVVKNACGA